MQEVNRRQMGSAENTGSSNNINDYELVILAAKLARKINNSRITSREQMAQEEINELDRRKVTTVALEEIGKGKIRITREQETPIEETYDLT